MVCWHMLSPQKHKKHQYYILSSNWQPIRVDKLNPGNLSLYLLQS
jgi:hypothetical protein